MPVFTDDEIQERLESQDNLVNKVDRLIVSVGKISTHDGIKTPNEIKALAGILVNEGEKQKSIAKEFGVSQPAISSYINDDYSVGKEIVQEKVQKSRDRINGKKEQAEEKALDLALDSLGLIDLDEIKKKPGTLLKVASVASSIAEKMRPSQERAQENNVSVHFFVAPQRSIESYETVEAEGS